MVTVNYRIDKGIPEAQVIGFFEHLGYIHLGRKEKTVKKGNRFIPIEELIRTEDGGRYHLYIEFGHKRAGKKPYPQAIVHAHYDLILKKGDKWVHQGRHNIEMDMDEMYEIHNAMKRAGIGSMEYKSKNAAYGTRRRKYLPLLKEVIKRDYEHFEDETYKKRLDNAQITVQIVEISRFLHIICVYAIGEEHELYLDKAKEELKRLINESETLIRRSEENFVKISDQLKTLQVQQKVLKDKRDELNSLTKAYIEELKQIEAKIASKLSIAKDVYKKKRDHWNVKVKHLKDRKIELKEGIKVIGDNRGALSKELNKIYKQLIKWSDKSQEYHKKMQKEYEELNEIRKKKKDLENKLIKNKKDADSYHEEYLSLLSLKKKLRKSKRHRS